MKVRNLDLQPASLFSYECGNFPRLHLFLLRLSPTKDAKKDDGNSAVSWTLVLCGDVCIHHIYSVQIRASILALVLYFGLF